MKSKLVVAALGAILLSGAGIATADDRGRQPHNGPGVQYRAQDRGWDERARWRHDHGRPQWAHPGHHHWKQPPRWAYGHYYYGYPGSYWNPYPGRGDGVTIIFRGRFN